MRTLLIYFLALLAFTKAEEDRSSRKRRGYFHTSYPLGETLNIGGVDATSYGRDKFLRVPGFAPSQIDFSNQQEQHQIVELPPINYPISNAIDNKPVTENQEIIPPQSVGTALLPPNPPPATPVNAAAANVPAVGNAVFLGGGALGVIDLGGGAYALGSGSIGYSERRSNPRPSSKIPILPPIQAAPNLLPAAVNNPTPPPLLQTPYPNSGLPVDQNGYEYLPPDRIRFGAPQPQRPLRVLNNFAIPAPLQIQPQFPQFQPQAQSITQISQMQQQQQQQQQQQLQQQIQQQQQLQQQQQQQLEQQQQSPQEVIYGQRISNVFTTHSFR